MQRVFPGVTAPPVTIHCNGMFELEIVSESDIPIVHAKQLSDVSVGCYSEACTPWPSRSPSPVQIILNPGVVILLVAVGNLNGGALNPIILGNTGVNIIIRITIIYTDNKGDPNVQLTIVFDVVVAPEDWNISPCSYL